jgi:AmiR/NasT family two-component response regulator
MTAEPVPVDDGELAEARAQVLSLQTALESRETIGIALGLVMATYAIDQDRAFAYLARNSQKSNVKLRHIAATLVDAFARTGRLPPCNQDVQPPR